MKHNMRLSQGGHEQIGADDNPSLNYWTAAEEDVTLALGIAVELLASADCNGVTRWMDGNKKGQAAIDVAGLILAQRRFYIEGASKSLIEEMI